jgi:hypothetical protein
VICSRQELFEAIKKTLAQSTAEEKRQLREALLESLGGNRCGICGDEKRTLLFDVWSKTFFCFQCIGSRSAPPVFCRAITPSDVEFLKELKVVWETT